MKKCLIYFSVIGENYKKMLEMSISSLLYNGYTDDILVLTDENKIINEKIKYVNSINELKKINSKIKAKHMKSFIHKFVNLKDYEYVIYFDSDILFYKNISNFYKQMDENVFIVQYDRFNDITKNTITSGTEFLNQETRNKYKLNINSGMVGQKQNKNICIYKLWNDEMINKNFNFNSDQGALYSTVINNDLYDDIYESKSGDFYYDLKNYNDFVYIHYQGNGINKMTNDFFKYFK